MNELSIFASLIYETYFTSPIFVDEDNHQKSFCEDEESKLPLQLAIVGRPNVGKSTLLNTLLREERVLVGPEAGLTRDSVRAEFQYQGRTVYLVNICLLLNTNMIISDCCSP